MIFSSSRLLLLQLTEFRFHGEMLSCSVFSLPKAPISPLKAKAQFLQSRFPSFFHFIQRWSTSKWSRNPDIVHYIFHLISFSGVWLPAKSQTISHCLHFAISHGKCSGKSHMSDTMIIISSLWFAYDANIYASKLMWIVNCLEDFLSKWKNDGFKWFRLMQEKKWCDATGSWFCPIKQLCIYLCYFYIDNE